MIKSRSPKWASFSIDSLLKSSYNFIMISVTPLLNSYIAELQEISKSNKFKKLKTLSILVSKSKKLQSEIEDIGNKGYIVYIITTDGIDLEELKKEKRKSKVLHYAFPQVNEEHAKKDNKYLYIGSSLEISSRLKQHLGFIGSDKTFSLRLNNWAKGRKVNIDLYETDTKDNMQLFEDLLWRKYKPMLGRMGR